MLRQDWAHCRQISAQRRIRSDDPVSHARAHASQISAHALHAAVWCAEPRPIKFAHVLQISTQSRHASAHAAISGEVIIMHSAAHSWQICAQLVQSSMHFRIAESMVLCFIKWPPVEVGTPRPQLLCPLKKYLPRRGEIAKLRSHVPRGEKNASNCCPYYGCPALCSRICSRDKVVNARGGRRASDHSLVVRCRGT